VSAQTRRAAFLDRDGVLNRAVVRDGRPFPPPAPDAVERLPGVEAAVRRLDDAGWLVFVVTNQPDVARGTTTRAQVDAINDRVVDGLPVTEVLVCPHDDADGCACRKPSPGMLLDAAARWGVDLASSVTIGDRWRDVEAGARAGTATVLIDYGYAEPIERAPDHVVADLPAAVDAVLANGRARSAPDDWESHWAEYSDAASDNPAQEYRRQLIVERIGDPEPPMHLLDIGSGQGDLLASLRGRWPTAHLAGLELSEEGIHRAQAKVPSARFHQVDLMVAERVPAELEGWADVAVCSEVLEHVDDPVRLLRVALQAVKPGGSVVVTVPGGPRTAFDKFIGHRRHFRPDDLRLVLERAGLDDVRVSGTGFPFFDLYKLLVLVRGPALVRDIASSQPRSRLATATMRAFGLVLRPPLNSSRFGWQVAATARRPPEPPPGDAGPSTG
jgi:histidinol-phosphate phosphatase family protein